MKKQPVSLKQPELGSLVTELRGLIHSARRTAATTVNTLQVLTNFEIGLGFSEGNLVWMRNFYLGWKKRVIEFPRSLSGNDVAICQKPSGELAQHQIWQTACAKLASQKGQAPTDQFRRIAQTPSTREYSLYLPSKELLRQKLMDWLQEQGARA